MELFSCEGVKMFRLNNHHGIKYYTIDAFESTGLVNHCFTTRDGGVSKNEYESMNLRVNSNDTKENIEENFKRICDEISIDYKNLVFSNQVHDDKIYTVTKKDMGMGLKRTMEVDSSDALICSEPKIPIVTFYADCVPLYFLDPNKRVIAMAHSGWRGTVKQIGYKTIEKMKADYGCRSEDILCAIGPHIGKCHFEVNQDVAQIFAEEFGSSTVDCKNGYYVDMQRAIINQFNWAGISDNNITCADICTYCNSNLLFSHRKTQGKRGNLAAIMELKV